MTLYVVLEETAEVPGYECWRLFEQGIEATSAKSALRKALKGKGDLGNSYVAVPERSWQPYRIEVETQHRLKIG